LGQHTFAAQTSRLMLRQTKNGLISESIGHSKCKAVTPSVFDPVTAAASQPPEHAASSATPTQDHSNSNFSRGEPENGFETYRGKMDSTTNPFRRPNQPYKIDLEQGLTYPHTSFCSSSAISQSDDFEFMMLRRFACLHARFLLDREAKFLKIEEQREKLDKIDDRVRALDARATQPEEAMGVVHYWDQLLGEIEGKLSEFNSMVSQTRYFTQVDIAKPRQQYISIGQYLKWGPDIHMDRSETGDIVWQKYELAVKEFLNEKGSAFLNRPLDRQCFEEGHEEANSSRSLWSTVKFGVENRKDYLLGFAIGQILMFCWHILFWTGHITAAMVFGLVANMPGSGENSIARLCLAFWYGSAAAIVAQGSYVNGRRYILQIIMAGILFNLTALCVLHNFLSVPTSSAVKALPAFSTVVLLLVRTM
ncbi:MAG: hypothetical protein Q9205_007902, partial [Flavoplaca limonia]